MSAPRRLLIVAPTFPPHPSPATHRARFLARYGPSAGWSVEVLSVDPAYYEERLDEELMRLVPADATITRIPVLDAHVTRRVGVGDIGLRSYIPLRRELDRIAAERRPDAVFIPGGPFYTFRLGLTMRRRHGIPYVLDYTDPWVFPLTAEQQTPRSKAYWARRLAEMLEPPIARGASHILGVSEQTFAGMRERYPDIPATRFSAYPFGFEPEDFAALRAHPRPNAHWEADGRAHLVHVGAISPHGFETLRAIFAAVRALCDADASWRDRIRLHFIGTTYDPRGEQRVVEPVARELGVGDVVIEEPKRVAYLDALNLLTQADGVLVLGSTEAHYTASKVFPCLLAERPLLAVTHAESNVTEILREAGTRDLVTYDDADGAPSRVDAIAAAIRAIVERPPVVRPVSLERMAPYTAESISRRIFATLDAVAAENEAAQARVS